MSDPGLRCSRRCDPFRRLFFWSASAVWLASALGTLPAYPQSGPSARIERREIRITRDRTGDYRVVEAVQLTVLDERPDADRLLHEPLNVVTLPHRTRNLVQLASDLAGGRVRFDPPHLTLSGPLSGPTVRIVVSYRLPPDVPHLALSSQWPTDEVVVEVARGSVEARLDEAFARVGRTGPPSRPRDRYVARAIEANRRLRVRFMPRRIDWRARTAVILATALAAAAAFYSTWRVGDRRP